MTIEKPPSIVVHATWSTRRRWHDSGMASKSCPVRLATRLASSVVALRKLWGVGVQIQNLEQLSIVSRFRRVGHLQGYRRHEDAP